MHIYSLRPTLRAVACTSAIVALAALTSSRGDAQGVRFTLSPSAEYTWWDKQLGIENSELLGGRIGADFGSLLSVSGYFHTRGGLGVSRDSLSTPTSAAAFRRTATDAATYGINLALRLSPARFAPFISVGAGVMRFDPDSAPRVEQINYRYGGGFHYDMSPNVRAMVMAEDSRFRLAPNALFGGAPVIGAPGNNSQRTHSNWVVSAGLGLAVGGSLDRADPEADRWSAASIPMEIFAGRLEFDDDALAKQALVGVRTGIDVGNYVGLRGFYWQGRSGDLRTKQSLNGYGGEAQFNFNASRGPAPFLILGAGRLDFDDKYRDSLGRARADETALILGGGIGIRLSDQFRVNAAARDYVRGPQQLDSVSGLKQLTNNWMFTVGLSYNINRSRRDAEPTSEPVRAVSPWSQDARRREMRAADSLRARERVTDSVRVATMVSARMTDSLAAVTAKRTVTLPIPTVGELYVRYGDSTSRTMTVVAPRNASDSAMAQNSSRDATDAALRQLQARIDSLSARLRESEARRNVPARVDTVVVPPMVMVPGVAPATIPGMRPMNEQVDDGSARQIHSISPYIAGVDQMVLGVQLDAGPIFGISSLRFVPDFAIGFGSNASLSLAAGAQYEFTPLRMDETSSFRPHLRAGLGFLAASGDRDSKFGVNIAYGATYLDAASVNNPRRPVLFVEHQGIDFFSTNRFLLGLRWKVR